MTPETTNAEHVLYARKGRIAEITLNRPDKRNAINDEMTVELRRALRDFDADKSARVAILHGNGKAFSTGADVRQRQTRPREELERFGGPQHPDAHAGDVISRSVNSKPIIAAVHGYVMGLAVGLALDCEIVVADEGTQFQVTETPRGLGGARYWGKMHFIGCSSFATDVTLTGRFFSAEEAHGAGLIARVTKAGEYLETAREIADQVAGHPPLSVQQSVRARRIMMDELERRIAANTDLMRLYLTEDFETSVKAFLNKDDKPEYKGK